MIYNPAQGRGPDLVGRPISTVEPRPVPEIGLSLERLDRAISALDEAMCVLHERLAPVCRESRSTDANVKQEPELVGASPVCKSIVEQTRRLESLVEGLRRNIADLEI